MASQQKGRNYYNGIQHSFDSPPVVGVSGLLEWRTAQEKREIKRDESPPNRAGYKDFYKKENELCTL